MFDIEILLNALPTLASAAVVTVELTFVSSILGLCFGTVSVVAQLSGGRAGYLISRA